MPSSNLNLKVRRRQPELLSPAEPAPYEWKQFSDIDDQSGFRLLMKAIWFYAGSTTMAGQDPADVVRRGLSKALSYYYPIAGRLREGPGEKLSVECNGEGIVFVEADADLSLEHFGGALQPPFPCMDELFPVNGWVGIVDSPLIVVQVTRLSCGGFIMAAITNHAISDGHGTGMIVHAASELARGAEAPSVFPVWERERLFARSPPRVTYLHREFDDPPPQEEKRNKKELLIDSVFFNRADVELLRAQLQPHLRESATSFEILAACLWRCRTIALRSAGAAAEETRLLIAVNSRSKFEPPLPEGFYGNDVTLPAAVANATELIEKPLEYGVELVRECKRRVTEEYVRSVADLLVTKGRPHYRVAGTYLISDFRRVGFGEVDWGWGKPLFGGPADLGEELISFLVPFKNRDGDDGVLVPICLPESAMERFKAAVNQMVRLQQRLPDQS